MAFRQGVQGILCHPQKGMSEMLLKDEWGSQRREEGEGPFPAEKRACSKKQRHHMYLENSTEGPMTVTGEQWEGPLGGGKVRRCG